MLKETASRFLDLIYPRECIITGALPDLDSFRYLSSKGIQALKIVKNPHCNTCGHPFHGIVSTTRDCPHCRELQPVYRNGKTLLLLNEAARQLIHTLKYEKGTFLIPDLIELARQTTDYFDFLKQATLIPVPLAPRKRRERGYNQSQLLAKSLAKAAGSTMDELLIRTRDTPSQTTLKRKERESNMKHAFSLRKKASVHTNTRYIIIDDVFTTGSTLNACARVLRDSGAQNIDIATIGHG